MKPKQTSQKHRKWDNMALYLPFCNDKMGYGSIKRWEKMKAVGFVKFIFRSTLGFIAFFFMMRAIIHLIEFRLPTQEDWIAYISIYTGLGVILSLIKWKGYEYKCSRKKSLKKAKINGR